MENLVSSLVAILYALTIAVCVIGFPFLLFVKDSKRQVDLFELIVMFALIMNGSALALMVIYYLCK